MKIEKTPWGYKIYKKSFFGQKTYDQIITSKRADLKEDLVFETEENARRYLDYLKSPPEDMRLFSVKTQLQKALDSASIDPKDFTWADTWGGNGIWGLALSQLTSKEVVVVDIDKTSYEPPFYKTSDLVSFKQINTDIAPLPTEVTALFLRSTITASSIEKLLDLNPQLKVVLIIPEGLNSHEFMPFKRELTALKKNFDFVQKKDIKSDFGVKGSHSNTISVNKFFPLLIAKNSRP